jgi:cell volume regulation protein A
LITDAQGEIMIDVEYIFVAAAVLLLLSIIASKTSGRLGVPALLFFLIIGMLAGSEGLAGIYFDDPWLAQSLGVLALAFILFSGGLDTDWRMVKPVMWKGIGLSTLGVLGTACLVGWFSATILNFSLFEGLLLGAIVSSTDAAAVFSILRSKKVSLKGPLKPLLELESGSNDPMAVFLTIGFIRLLTHAGASLLDFVPMFFSQMVVGAALGYGIGRAAVFVTNRLRLEYEGLYSVFTLTVVLLTYGVTASLGGNGFLAVYLAGLVMGNSDFIHKKSILRFHDGLAWLMQIAMFLALGLLVFPSRLIPIAGISLLVSLFLMIVARPVCVLAILLPAKMNFREKTMVSWVGLRGAVPIVLATFPLLAKLPNAWMIFDIVFFIVLTSVLLQGTSIPIMARWLRVDVPLPPKPQLPIEIGPSCNLKNELVEITIPLNSAVVGKQIVELGLPPGTLIVLISRNAECFAPGGGTVLAGNDSVLLFGESADMPKIRSILEGSSLQDSSTP